MRTKSTEKSSYNYKSPSEILPPFPRTMHLPKSNVGDGDLVADDGKIKSIFQNPITIEEKIDGASVGIGIYNKEPLIRNRNHILSKGYVKQTSAKKQFLSIWNWFYKHKKQIELLHPLMIYGEWMYAAHGIHYTKLPDLLIAYDLYDYEKHKFLPSNLARKMLIDSGFYVPKLYFEGSFSGSIEDLNLYINQQCLWADDISEGIYIKVLGANTILDRFKLVRENFIRGRFWNDHEILKNTTHI